MAKKTGDRQLELGGIVTPKKEPTSAIEFVPAAKVKTLPTLREAARGCRGCPLWEHATQTVFGVGPERPIAVMVGEVPGDQEDREGIPFVGPAGQLLDELLGRVGIDRSQVYVTNAVKHFKYEPRGKKRIHQKPSPSEIWACRPWLDEELKMLRPEVVVALGATAAHALLGPSFQLVKMRGQWSASAMAPKILATMHPAALLRARGVDEDAYQRQLVELTDDLRLVAAELRGGQSG
jgi:DNA polymerase